LLARDNNAGDGNSRNAAGATGSRITATAAATPAASSIPAFATRRLATSIFETRIDLKHPLGFGLTSEVLPVIKESLPFIPIEGDTINPVSRYAGDPLLNGHLDPADKKTFSRFAPIKIRNNGGGNVILFAEDPVFRGIWDATERTFINAILLGSLARR
jgi:hypothetical protein